MRPSRRRWPTSPAKVAARRFRLPASVRPWRPAAEAIDRRRDRQPRRDLPAGRHGQMGRPDEGRAQRADRQRDRRRRSTPSATRAPSSGSSSTAAIPARRRARSRSLDEKERKVEFADLGIADAAHGRGREAATRAAGGGLARPRRGRRAQAGLQADRARPAQRRSRKGGLVAFYAAQTDRDDAGDAAAQGRSADATATGCSPTRSSPSSRRTPRRHLPPARPGRAAAIFGRRPHPADAAVRRRARRAASSAPRRRRRRLQWPVKVEGSKATIGAGLLHRLSPAASSPSCRRRCRRLSEALGYLEVKIGQEPDSRVKPVEFDDKPALKLADIPPTPMRASLNSPSTTS